MSEIHLSRLIRVALPVPLRRQFDYLAPRPLPPVGSRVRVPFGRQFLVGLVTEHPESSDLPTSQLKPADLILDEHPVFPACLWRLLNWASQYYQYPLGEVLHYAMPALLRQGEPAQPNPIEGWRLTAHGYTVKPPRNAQRQQQALALLKEGPLSAAELRDAGIDTPVLNKLADKCLAERCHLFEEQADWRQGVCVNRDDQHQLNTEQAMAVASVLSQGQQFGVFLLDGVTGSGKTEVYLQLIAPVLERGQQVLLLVPEIGLTPQTLTRFRRRLNAPVLTLHSAMNDRERLDAWLTCQRGEAAVLIGTRSALFTPFASLGLILIDEEHDGSFKQQDGLRYHARDLAIMRAREEHCPILLGSATPSLESLYNVQRGKFQRLTLQQRAGGAQPARQVLLDIKNVSLQAGVSPQLLQLMGEHLAQGNQVMLFLNRRGYAQSLLCHHCGWIAACARCDAYYSLHLGQHRLHCHHCDSLRPIPAVCPQCGSPALQATGVGTEQVETMLGQRFPTYRAIRIDRDNTRLKGELENYLDGIRKQEYQILIGTQMLAKGHHFPDVTLVGLLDVDGALFSADFRATERLAQLYTQVAGRAGRASKPGLVVLQTHHPEHLLLQDLVNNGYGHFARTCLQERAALGLPPYSYQAMLRADGTQKPYVEQFMQAVAKHLSQIPLPPGSMWVGPVSAQMEKRAGRYRMQLLLQARERPALAWLISRLLPDIEQLPETRRVRWLLDVDPQELF